MQAAARFRFAFERWLQSAYQYPAAKDLDQDARTGGYINPHVMLAWQAWSAGRAYIGRRPIRQMVLGDIMAVGVVESKLTEQFR